MGAKFKMAFTPASTIVSATSWAAPAGVVITPMPSGPPLPASLPALGDVLHGEPGDELADRAGVDVEQPDDAETFATKPGRPRKRMAEMTHARHDDGPLLVDPELPLHLAEEEVDVEPVPRVPYVPKWERSLAHFGGVHAAGVGEPGGRDRGDRVACQLVQKTCRYRGRRTTVRLGYLPSEALGHGGRW